MHVADCKGDRVIWCGRRDSNPHGLLRLDLNQVRLPFRHSRITTSAGNSTKGATRALRVFLWVRNRRADPLTYGTKNHACHKQPTGKGVLMAMPAVVRELGIIENPIEAVSLIVHLIAATEIIRVSNNMFGDAGSTGGNAKRKSS